MKEKAMIAKMPYSILFEGGMYGNQDNRMVIVRIVGKLKNNGLKLFRNYIKECKKYSQRPEIFEWYEKTEPVYVGEKEVADDIITTIVYPFEEDNISHYHLTNRFSNDHSDTVGIAMNTPLRFKGNNRAPVYITDSLHNVVIDITDYNRTLGSRTGVTIISKDEYNREAEDNTLYFSKVGRRFELLDDVRNNISIKWSINHKKQYTHNSIVKVSYTIYEDLISGLNSREAGDMALACGTGSHSYPFGYSELHNRRLRPSNSNKFEYHVYGTKFKAIEIGNKIVMYDSNKALENFKDAIPEWDYGKFVIISQYNSFDRNSYVEGGRNREKIVIRFASPRDFSFREDGIQTDGDLRGSVSGKIWIKHKASYYNLQCDLTGRDSYSPAFDGIIPFGDKLEDAVNKLNAFLKCPTESRYVEYARTLLPAQVTTVGEGEDDILTTWFTSCVKAKKHSDDDILRAYKRMKINLVREYRALEEYINNYDFSKVIPVPRVILDKKTKENLYNSLHILARNIKINNVNNKKIKEINKTQAMVDLMFTKQGNIITGNYPLVKFYNPTTNALEFNYNKMKGELLNDKIKNRG